MVCASLPGREIEVDANVARDFQLDFVFDQFLEPRGFRRNPVQTWFKIWRVVVAHVVGFDLPAHALGYIQNQHNRTWHYRPGLVFHRSFDGALICLSQEPWMPE